MRVSIIYHNVYYHSQYYLIKSIGCLYLSSPRITALRRLLMLPSKDALQPPGTVCQSLICSGIDTTCKEEQLSPN